jgi:hypothetical protein
MAKRGKERSGAIVKRSAPVEHTASSLEAFDYLVARWGLTHQATLRKALEVAAAAARQSEGRADDAIESPSPSG